MPNVIVNGEDRTVGAEETLSDLLNALDKDPRTVAIEYNGEIVRRGDFATTRLSAADRLEIVEFVQGGGGS